MYRRCLTNTRAILFAGPPKGWEEYVDVVEAVPHRFVDHLILGARHKAVLTKNMFNVMLSSTSCSWEKVEAKVVYSEKVYDSNDPCAGSRLVTVHPLMVEKVFYTEYPLRFKDLAEKLVDRLTMELESYIEEKGASNAWRYFRWEKLPYVSASIVIDEDRPAFALTLAKTKAAPELKSALVMILEEPEEHHDGPDWELTGELKFAPVDPRIPLLVHVRTVSTYCGPDGYGRFTDTFKVLLDGKVIASSGHAYYNR